MITIIATIELWRHLVLGCQVGAPSLVLVTKASVLSPSCFVGYFNPVSSIIIPIIHVNHRKTICLLNRVMPLNTASFSPLKYIVPTFGILYLDLLIGC